MNIEAKSIGFALGGVALAVLSGVSLAAVNKRSETFTAHAADEEKKDAAAVVRNTRIASIGGIVTGVALLAHAVTSAVRQST